MRPKGNIDFQNTRASFSQRQDNQVATISFSCCFGKPYKKEKQVGQEMSKIEEKEAAKASSIPIEYFLLQKVFDKSFL